MEDDRESITHIEEISDSEKIKLQSKTDEVNSSEGVRIYHHELHAKHIKKSSILKLKTENGILQGHEEVRRFLEESVDTSLPPPEVSLFFCQFVIKASNHSNKSNNELCNLASFIRCTYM